MNYYKKHLGVSQKKKQTGVAHKKILLPAIKNKKQRGTFYFATMQRGEQRSPKFENNKKAIFPTLPVFFFTFLN